MVPVAVATTGLITADTELTDRIERPRRWNQISDIGLGMSIGSATTFYLVGKGKGDSHAIETGRLGSEAGLHSFLVSSAIQRITQRARPDEINRGTFFSRGDSFPSSHAAVTWSIASVIAHEYPGWGTKLLAYGMASAVSVGRVGGRKHFPSDAVVGSALGWFIGRQTYRAHHDRMLPGVTFDREPIIEKVRNPLNGGTTYVPVDSWVYPAYERLAALGYVPSGMQTLKPWTRLQFAELLREAKITCPEEGAEISTLYRDLQAEFSEDLAILDGTRNLDAHLDSVYVRTTAISGMPLTDGVHFGQTFVNDYGRPYQSGMSALTGVTTRAEAGPFAFYVRGEYQHAPSSNPLPASVTETLAHIDGLPIANTADVGATNRFRLLESYVALNLQGWQLSFGKQSLWWGPASSSDLVFSNNAEPITMLRLSRVAPIQLGILGQVQADTFMGQVNGYHFLRLGPSFELTGSYEHYIDPQPYIWGHKLSVQPTANLQLGISVTTVFAGLGRPLTFDTFLHTFSFSGNAQRVEPGDRRTGFDFSYRIPGLRNWLVLYSGSVSEDQPNPLAYPRHSAWNPGVYLPQLPGLRRWDFHAEAAYTNLPNDPRSAVFYRNRHYAGGYTNNGQIMGAWLGPQAQAYSFWTTHWRSARNKLQFGFRNQVVDRAYIGGGRIQNAYGSYESQVRPDIHLKLGLHHERWNFPVLSKSPQSNTAVTIQFTFTPAKLDHLKQNRP